MNTENNENQEEKKTSQHGTYETDNPDNSKDGTILPGECFGLSYLASVDDNRFNLMHLLA